MTSIYHKKSLKQLRTIAFERGLMDSDELKKSANHWRTYFIWWKWERWCWGCSRVKNWTRSRLSETARASMSTELSDDNSEKLQLLILQLQIEQIQLQQMQLSGSNSGSVSIVKSVTDASVISRMKNRLPVMTRDCDVTSYFTNFERCMELHDITDQNVSMLNVCPWYWIRVQRQCIVSWLTIKRNYTRQQSRYWSIRSEIPVIIIWKNWHLWHAQVTIVIHCFSINC